MDLVNFRQDTLQVGDFEDFPVRFEIQDGMPCVIGIDLAGPLDISKRAILLAIAELDPEDKSEVKLHSSKTGQTAIGLFPSGAYQIIIA